LVNETGDLEVVLLQDHHVTVTEDAAVLQPNVLGLHADWVGFLTCGQPAAARSIVPVMGSSRRVMVAAFV